MDCNQTKELLSLYIDDLLEKEEKAELEAHLENCTQCKQELKTLQDTLSLLYEMDEITPPEGFRTEIINKLQGTKPDENIFRNDKTNLIEKMKNLTPAKIFKLSSIAAGILLIISITYLTQIENKVYDIAVPNTKSIDGAMTQEIKTAKIPQRNSADYSGSPRAELLDKRENGNKDKSINVDGSPSTFARKVVTNGSLVMETKEFDKTVSTIDKILQKVQGYYENRNIDFQGETKTGNFTLKIPAPKFLEATEEIKKLGNVKNTSSKGDDVTTEYYDTKARIKVLKEQENRLLAILKKAKDVDEILNVENELRRIREEIELNQSRMQVLDSNIAMSTLNLEITEVKEITHITPPGIKGTLLKTWQAFVKSINTLIKLIENLVIFLGGALPFLAILALGSIGYLYYRKRNT